MTFRSSRWRAGWVASGALAALVLAGQAPPVAAAQLAGAEPSAADAVRAKATDEVRRDVAADGTATFLVLLKDRADLSGARSVADKASRGGQVRQTLLEHADRTQAGLRELLRERGAPFEAYWISNAIKVTGDAELLAEVARRPEVSRIEPDQELALPQTVTATPDTAPAVVAEPAAAARQEQEVEWNIDRIGAPKVWDEFGTRGDGIVVGVIDSGAVITHEALAGTYRGRAADGTVDHNYNWMHATGACGAPCDEIGHGSHVTGIAVGSSPPGVPQIGVAPGARWIAAAGLGRASSLLSAGQWMLAPTDSAGQNPRPDLAPHVVNNAWSYTSTPSTFYADIIAAWIDAGIFPVFAVGNSGGANGACGTTVWPASLPDAYAVGMTTSEDTVEPRSSRGPVADGPSKPDIAAPGQLIRSVRLPEGYRNETGTSMASAHVSGAVALLWSAVPELARDVAATKLLLDDTARDIDDTACGGTVDDNYAAGEGLIDVYAAASRASRAVAAR